MHTKSFLVSFDPFVLLRPSAPISFSLSFNNGSAIVVLEGVLRSKLTDVPVESLKIYLTLLKRQNTLIQPLLAVRISCSVKAVRISEIGRMKLKIRRIINQQLFRRNRLCTFRFFTHGIPSFATIYNNRIAFYKYRIPAHKRPNKTGPKPIRETEQHPEHSSAAFNPIVRLNRQLEATPRGYK